MSFPRLCRVVRTSLFVMFVLSMPRNADAQGAKKSTSAISNADSDADHEEERARWFLRGRTLPGKSAAELRHRAYRSKMQSRAMGTNAALGAQAESQAASASVDTFGACAFSF